MSCLDLLNLFIHSYSKNFRRHRWQAISPIAIDVTVPWFVCMSLSCIVPNCRRYRLDLFCIRQIHVSPRSCYNLAYIGQPILPKVCSKFTHPCWF